MFEKRVLVVDDHPLHRESFCTLIRSIAPSLLIDVAGDMKAMLASLSRSPVPFMVFLDLDLPDVIGEDAVTMARSASPTSKIIVVSASNKPLIAERVVKLGASTFIPKRYAIDSLILNLTELLRDDSVHKEASSTTFHSDHNMSIDRDVLTGRIRKLSARERDVLALMLKGLSNREIGVALKMAIGTVKVHVSSVLRSLHANSRTHAVAAIWQSGITIDTPNTNTENAMVKLDSERGRRPAHSRAA